MVCRWVAERLVRLKISREVFRVGWKILPVESTVEKMTLLIITDYYHQ